MQWILRTGLFHGSVLESERLVDNVRHQSSYVSYSVHVYIVMLIL